tara:strand:- start:343 stop:798 length:456 start_codon:yes stop_codon:yes gene_type:complete
MSYLVYQENVLKEKSIIDTDVTYVTTSTTYTDIEGSEISFTPHSLANTVVYEFTCQFSHNPDTSNWTYFQLYEDQGSGYASLGNGYQFVYREQNAWFENRVFVRFVLPTYSGSRSYKIKCRAYSNSYQVRLHRWDQNTQKQYPTVHMFDIL